MRRWSAILLAVSVCVSTAVPLAAQSPGQADAAMDQQRPAPPPQRPAARPGVRRPRPPVGFGALVTFEALTLDAADTFDAVIGKHRLNVPGGVFEVTNLFARVFARVGFSQASADGERAIVIDRNPVPLGIPLEVTLSPIEIAAGWRQPFGRRGLVAGYGGAGFLSLGYKESSQFGTAEDNSNERFTGSLLFGGVDVNLFRGITAGVEVQYRSVPDAIGGGQGCPTGVSPPCSVADAFGETNLGGRVIRFLVGYRR